MQLKIVSIPFKREGVSKAYIWAHSFSMLKVSIPFKREGVSKVILAARYLRYTTLVSIPFKREGVSKD